ncbi:7032_t:CDS:2 [Acaulospora colombiana]|uniref:7032_t:CDS:1 n=1 Tax=Acaulospora colombiana TaxID=27376 RepID=A0ACA9LII2_9GLOM|nr:7032_t:CDS:2 [Acaulospora colombiana]
MNGAQVRIAETINQFYEDSTENVYAGRKYKEAIDELELNCRTHLDEPYGQTVTEPVARFCAYFPHINEAIKKREKKLLDYDAHRSKVRKMVEKSSDDPTKLSRAEEVSNMARELYESLNTQLITELPRLIDLRVPYLDPTFEALVKIQLKFCQDSYDSLNSLQEYFPPQDSPVDSRIDETDLPPLNDTPFTLEELSKFTGSNEKEPIYVAVKGIVFDVSENRQSYGPGGNYHIYAGKDVSKGLGLSSLNPEDAIGNYSTLNEEQVDAFSAAQSFRLFFAYI